MFLKKKPFKRPTARLLGQIGFKRKGGTKLNKKKPFSIFSRVQMLFCEIFGSNLVPEGFSTPETQR